MISICLLALTAAHPSVNYTQRTQAADLIALLELNHGQFQSLPGLYVSFDMSYEHLRGTQYFNTKRAHLVNVISKGRIYSFVVREDDASSQGAWNGIIGTDSRNHHSYRILPEPSPSAYTLAYYIDHLFFPDGRGSIEDPSVAVATNEPLGGPDFWLPVALRKHGADYHLDSVKELVDGAECIIMERPGRDKLWIDPGIGHGIRKREFYWEDGALRDRVFLRDFRQMTADMWLPWSIVREHYCTPADFPRLRNQLAGTRRIRVTAMRVEEPTDDTFVVALEEGMWVSDTIRGLHYQVLTAGEGERHIADAESLVRRDLQGRSVWWYVVPAIVGLLIAILLLSRWVHRRAIS